MLSQFRSYYGKEEDINCLSEIVVTRSNDDFDLSESDNLDNSKNDNSIAVRCKDYLQSFENSHKNIAIASGSLASGLLCLYWCFSIAQGLILSYALLQSVRAIQRNNDVKKTFWLQYWIFIVPTMLISVWITDPLLLCWFPGYSFLKALILGAFTISTRPLSRLVYVSKVTESPISQLTHQCTSFLLDGFNNQHIDTLRTCK